MFGDPASSDELEDVGWHPIGRKELVPFRDVTQFMLARAVAVRDGTAPPEVPLFCTVRSKRPHPGLPRSRAGYLDSKIRLSLPSDRTGAASFRRSLSPRSVGDPMGAPILPGLLSRRLPVFYGWIVLACLCCAGFARQGPAVATLSIFIEPLTREFGWSRTALSGAASLGGLLAAIAAPLIGPVLDRRGSRLVLCAAVLVNGALLMLLSLTPSLLVFYLLFCVARMNWAAPFELGLYGALNNWFVRRRALASSILNLAQAAGLIAMPLVAQIAIVAEGWRAGWLAIGAIDAAGRVCPDLAVAGAPSGGSRVAARRRAALRRAAPPLRRTRRRLPEPAYSRRQALGTGAFWLLLLYTVLVYPVQAGVSLHQAPFLIERGIDPTIAATIVSTFSLTSALATLACGALPRARADPLSAGADRRDPDAWRAAAARRRDRPLEGYIAAGVFGFGIGAILTLLPIAWADYFGRAHFGAIRGIALAGAGARPGRRAGALGRAARPDRRLRGLAAMLRGARRAQRRRGVGGPAAGHGRAPRIAVPSQRCSPKRVSHVAVRAGSS